MEEEKNTKSEITLREEKILEFWKEHKIFEKSLKKPSPNGEFVFYDGPVTANSAPVLHTMEPFAFKDIIPRYKTMCGSILIYGKILPAEWAIGQTRSIHM